MTVISTAAARGCDTTTLGLFKERSPSVPITPHFTFHISSHLSGPLDRSQFIFLSSLLYTLSFCHKHSRSTWIYLCASISFQSLSLSLYPIRLSLFSLLSSPLSSSLYIPPRCEPSRDCVFFLLPLPAVFDSSLRIRGGSRF